MSQIRIREPGYRFKSGALYVFTRRSVSVIRGWPEASAVRKRDGAGWQEYEPHVRLVHPYRSRRKKRNRSEPTQLSLFGGEEEEFRRVGSKRRALDAFRFSLPREIAHRLEPLPGRQFALLRLLQRHDGFPDLLHSHRPLAYCVANPEIFDRGSAADILRRKQREIMEWLGFPGRRSAVQALRRVCPESLNPQTLRALQRLLRCEDRAKRVGHAPRLNAGLIELLADDALAAAAKPTLLEEVAHDPREKYRPRTSELLHETLHLHEEIRPQRPVPVFSSRDRLEARHTELSGEYHRLHQDRILACSFPRPPVRGTPEIVPLRSALDLVHEGSAQKNCVAAYAPRVESGEVYIYRVLAPQRATLSLKKQWGGDWSVSELLASCNRSVSAATESAVENWLEDRRFG